MPFFYKIKSKVEQFFTKSKLFHSFSLDYILQFLSKLFPHPLSKKFDFFNKKYEHHLILKFDKSIYNQIKSITNQIFNNKSKNNILHCSPIESKKITLARFVMAGANMRYACSS